MHLKPQNGRTKLHLWAGCCNLKKKKRPKYGFSAHKTAADFNNHLLRVYPSGYSKGWLVTEGAIWSKMPVTCLFSAQWAHAPARHKDLYYRPSITASNKNTLKFVIKNIRCWATSENISSCQIAVKTCGKSCALLKVKPQKEAALRRSSFNGSIRLVARKSFFATLSCFYGNLWAKRGAGSILRIVSEPTL